MRKPATDLEWKGLAHLVASERLRRAGGFTQVERAERKLERVA
jgi:hypothetical protein